MTTTHRLTPLARFWIAVCAAIACGCSSSPAEIPAGPLALAACDIPGEPGGGRCGSLVVYENRTTRKGRMLALNVVVVPASGTQHEPDPIFWLEGGPGAAATNSIGPVSGQFLGGLRPTRDLVFVDIRGTGQSNPLQCTGIGDEPNDLDRYFGPLFPLGAIRACRQALERIADLTQYTTSIAMDDLDDVRKALGYEQINLAGASYGTLAAQAYMRQHPAHVRAAFLVGIAPPDFRLPLPFAAASQHAWDRALEDCAADAMCASAFPNVAREFDAVLARFEHGPIDVDMIDPTGAPRKVRLEREAYVERLRAMLYTTGGARFVPMVVHRAFLNDFATFQQIASRFNLARNSSRGLYFSITCSESIPFITEAEIVAATRGTFLGDRRIRAHQAACQEWPHATVSADFVRAVQSDRPVIFFSGEADGATPPWFATPSVLGFPRSRQIVALHTGHQIDSPCTTGLMEAFLKNPDAARLDASCASTLQRPPFATALTR